MVRFLPRFKLCNVICRRFTARALAKALLLFVLICIFGCNSSQKLQVKVVQGAVTYEDKPVEEGTVRFVPLEGTRGPLSVAAIDHGHYRVEARGGVPIGKHRIEVDAWGKTGRKITKTSRFEAAPEDERVRLGPATYADAQSPLRFDLTPESDGQFDIKIPKN